MADVTNTENRSNRDAAINRGKPDKAAARITYASRYCAECGCNAYETREASPGYWRKECAECGSTGPFMAENPHYGPGNPDWEHNRTREVAE